MVVMFSVAAAIRAARPPNSLAGRLAAQSMLFALGEGTFMTGSAVFLTQVVGVSATQVGVGLTVAGIASFLAAFGMGTLVDRYGAKRMWALSAAGQGGMFCFWPFIDGFGHYLAMAVVMEIFGALGQAAHGAYVIDVLPANARTRSRAYMYSALNLGFTLGAAAGGVALTFHSNDVLKAVPWFAAIVFGFNALFVMRLPNASHDDKSAEERKQRVPGPGPFRNVGWLCTTFLLGVMWTNQVILNVVIPLWVVQQTDAPRVLLAFLFGTNTVMCIVLPMAAARGVTSTGRALTWLRISSAFFVLSCLITLATHETIGWATVVLIWVGHVTVTGAELFLTPAHWQLEADLMDPRQRGRYQAAAEVSGTLGKVWAPAAFTFLALSWGSPGWLVIAVVPVVAVLLMPFAVRSAQSFLKRHQIPVG